MSEPNAGEPEPEPKPKKKTAEKQPNIEEEHRFIFLRAQGKSYTAIAKDMNIGRGKAIELGRRLRVAVGLEAALFRQVIREQYKVAAVNRAAAYSELLQAAFIELSKRCRGAELEGLKVTELLALALRVEERLLQEERPALVCESWGAAIAGETEGEFLPMD